MRQCADRARARKPGNSARRTHSAGAAPDHRRVKSKARLLFQRPEVDAGKSANRRIKIKDESRYGISKEWRETENEPLEDRLNDVIAGVAGMFEELRLRRQHEAEEQQRRWKIEEERRQAQMERKRGTIRFNRLLGYSAKVGVWPLKSELSSPRLRPVHARRMTQSNSRRGKPGRSARPTALIRCEMSAFSIRVSAIMRSTRSGTKRRGWLRPCCPKRLPRTHGTGLLRLPEAHRARYWPGRRRPCVALSTPRTGSADSSKIPGLS